MHSPFKRKKELPLEKVEEKLRRPKPQNIQVVIPKINLKSPEPRSAAKKRKTVTDKKT